MRFIPLNPESVALKGERSRLLLSNPGEYFRQARARALREIRAERQMPSTRVRGSKR